MFSCALDFTRCRTLRPGPAGRPTPARSRRGSVLVFGCFLMVVLLGMIALGVDSGYMYSKKGNLQRAVDAAALAGAGGLVDGSESATRTAVEYMLRNPVRASSTAVDEDQLEQQISQFMLEHTEGLDIEVGNWNPDMRRLESTSGPPSAMSVSMEYQDFPLFFASMAGRDNVTIKARSIATYQPRDIMLVLDFSASMNDDSDLGAINQLGQSSVEANIEAMWQDLDMVTYGNLNFDPDWVTIPGETIPANVTWCTDQVDVEATTTMEYVKLYFSNGSSQKFGTSSSSGTWHGTGDNYGKRITRTKVKINGVSETFNFYSNSDIRRGLGLDNVAYPYASGDWDDFIDYCRSHSPSMPWYDYNVHAAGYRRQFGMMLLINFWNRYKPLGSETEDLWKVSAQPVTAVKDSVDVFIDFIQAVPTNDRVGLAIYNSYSGDSILERGLTDDFDDIVDTVQHRQAGHYHHYTNIGAGMQAAREELDDEARPGVFKMIVLMTDGMANWIDGGYNASAARQYVLDEAQLSADRGYPVITISLGADADKDLMEDVAEITDGIHFNIPGGQLVSEYTQDLMDVFEAIAAHRPLKLVQ